MWNEIEAVARDVYSGKYGNGSARKQKLQAAGYDYNIVQSMVNYLFYGGEKPKIDNEIKNNNESENVNNEKQTLTVDVDLNVYDKVKFIFKV